MIFSIYRFVVRNLPSSLKGKLRKVRFIDKFSLRFRAKYKPDFIITNEGHKIYLDKNDVLHLSIHQDFEPLETKVLENNIKKGDVVLDLGANIGVHTLLLAKLVGENGRIYAFEPDPGNFKLLKKNINANKYRNIITIQKAITDVNDIIKFYQMKEYPAGNKIHDASNKLRFIEVESITLDSFFEELEPKIDFIKMDIEGAEVRALKGMKNIIKNNKDIKIIAEFCPILLKACGSGVKEYFKMLKEFKIYNLNEKENKLEVLNKSKIHTNEEEKGFTNFLLIKK